MKTFEENKQTLDLFFKPLVWDKERDSEVRAVDMVAWCKLTDALKDETIIDVNITTLNDDLAYKIDVLNVEFVNNSHYTQTKWTGL